MDSWQTTSRDLWIVVLRRGWSALAIVGITMFALLFWLFFIREDTFDTQAKLLVRIGNEQASPATMRTSSVLVTGDRMQDVNSEADILQSADLLNQVITELNLDQPLPPKPIPEKLLPRIKYQVKHTIQDISHWKDNLMISTGLKESLTPRQKALAQFRSALVATPERNSNILTVHLFVEQREYGAPILNKLLEMYETFRLKSYREAGTEGFFRQQADRTASSLQGAEDALRQFEDKWNLSAVQKQKEVLLEQIASNQTLMVNDSIELQDLTAKLSRAEVQAKAADPDIGAIGSFSGNLFPESLLQRLAELQSERQKLRLTELDSGARIRNNREQFRNAFEMVEANLKAISMDRRASYERRAQIVEALEKQIHGLQDKEGEWTDLKRRVKMLEDSYLDFQKRYEENQASSVMEEQKIGNVAIIQHATDPSEATGLAKTRLLGLGLLFAFMAAIAWIGVSDFFDSGVYTASEIEEHLGAPPLEVVPVLKNRCWFGAWRSYQRTDAFRRTAWALANSLSNGSKTIHFTSPSRGEGVTTAAWAAAEYLAQSQKLRPLVIELDQHSPTYLAKFSIHGDRSLNSFAPGKDPAGSIYSGPSGIAVAAIQSDKEGGHVDPLRVGEFIQAVRANYDLIVLDGPPLCDPDSGPISALSDSVILVVASGSASFKVLDRAKQELAAKHVSILGTILNKQKCYIPSWV